MSPKSLVIHSHGLSSRRGSCWSGESQNNVGPSLEDLVGDVKLPVDRLQKHALVVVDLGSPQSRHFAPGLGRVVAVLQILGRKDESCQKHATTALHTTQHRAISWLLHSKVMFWHMRLDED